MRERFELGGAVYEVDHVDKTVSFVEHGQVRPTGGSYDVFVADAKRKRLKGKQVQGGFNFKDQAEAALFKRATGRG